MIRKAMISAECYEGIQDYTVYWVDNEYIVVNEHGDTVGTHERPISVTFLLRTPLPYPGGYNNILQLQVDSILAYQHQCEYEKAYELCINYTTMRYLCLLAWPIHERDGKYFAGIYRPKENVDDKQEE